MRVDSRRHGTTCSCPWDWSIPKLIDSIVKFSVASKDHTALDPETDVPTAAWVGMSFSPSNPWIDTSANYLCRWDITHGLVSRSAKADHPHGAYCAHIFKHWKYLAVKWKKKLSDVGLYLVALFLDDKSSFKIGEPEELGGEGVAPLERNKATPTAHGKAAAAGTHSFTWAKGNPSMALICDVPDDPEDSFYRGQVCGVIQDAVFEPASALRRYNYEAQSRYYLSGEARAQQEG